MGDWIPLVSPHFVAQERVGWIEFVRSAACAMCNTLSQRIRILPLMGGLDSSTDSNMTIDWRLGFNLCGLVYVLVGEESLAWAPRHPNIVVPQVLTGALSCLCVNRKV